MNTGKVVAGSALLAASAAILAVTGRAPPALPLALGALSVGAAALAWITDDRRTERPA